MTERTTGLRRVFSLAAVYRFAQNAIGATRVRTTLIDGWIRPTPGLTLFDLGSGTSDIVEHLPGVEYVGLEPSEQYVDAARRRFGDRVTIVHGGIDEFDPTPWEGKADVVMSVGVLHHLTDDQVLTLLRAARTLLQPTGRFVSIDPCLRDGQHRIARALTTRDRGQHVRDEAGTRRLVEAVFPSVATTTRDDLLRVPYTHVIVEATDAPPVTDVPGAPSATTR